MENNIQNYPTHYNNVELLELFKNVIILYSSNT